MAYKNFRSTEIIEELGAELKKIRREKKLTITYVSEQLSADGFSISNTLLGRIENGERRIDDALFNALCAFYEVSPREVSIAASEAHIRHLSEYTTADNTHEYREEELIELFKNLNPEGQREIASLMRLMAYMDAFRK